MRPRIECVRLLVWAAVLLVCPNLAAQQEPTYTIQVNSDLVQISVIARDRAGRFVRDLNRDDFVVIEDGRPQQLSAVDPERVGVAPSLDSKPQSISILRTTAAASTPSAKGLRLVVLFFDFTSLQTDDAARALRAAEAYVGTLGPADRVAIVSLAAKLEIQQDFTADRTMLQRALKRLHGLSSNVVEASMNHFGAEDLNGDVFDNYRRLQSLRALTKALAQVTQKKSVVVFAGSGGSDSDVVGITATIDAAARANVAFYGIDAAGLTAIPPLGDATRASSHGTAVLSGTAVAQGGVSHKQDLLYALARGTGGRAFFDSNDFERPFRDLEADTREYYLLSYRSSNSRRDGRYRRISVRVRRPGVKVTHQVGYYGPREPLRATAHDVERIISEELTADLPRTGLPVLGFVNHLSSGKDWFYVPITVVLPAATFSNNGIASSVAIGLAVLDSRNRLIRQLRDGITADVATKHPGGVVQYETGAELPAGEYNVRVVVIQNATGEAGSFSTTVRLPRGESRMHVTSLLSGTLVRVSSHSPKSPLILNGSRLIVNPTAEYAANRPFAMQYQVDCGIPNHSERECDARQIHSSLQCFLSDQRVFNAEPPAAVATMDSAMFRVEVPSASLHPGTYICRVTAVNSRVGAFAFGSAQVQIYDELRRPKLAAGSFER